MLILAALLSLCVAQSAAPVTDDVVSLERRWLSEHYAQADTLLADAECHALKSQARESPAWVRRIRRLRGICQAQARDLETLTTLEGLEQARKNLNLINALTIRLLDRMSPGPAKTPI